MYTDANFLMHAQVERNPHVQKVTQVDSVDNVQMAMRSFGVSAYHVVPLNQPSSNGLLESFLCQPFSWLSLATAALTH